LINAFPSDTGQALSVCTTSNSMRSSLVFLVALGLASAADTTVKKLTVFGKLR